MMNVTSAIARGMARWGEKFDSSSLDAVDSRIRTAFNTGGRVIVESAYDDGSTWVRAGRVGITTGWRPAFLILWSDSQTGSSDTVGASDRVIATQAHDGRYYHVKTGKRVPSPRGSFGVYLDAGRAWT